MAIIEYLLRNMWQTWAIVASVCLILELSSGDFFIICFSVGAIASLIASLAGMNIYWQMGFFVVFTIVSIFTVRPIALRWLHKGENERKSNYDALIGRTGKVTQRISKGNSGYVQIDGDMWKAVSSDDSDIAEGQNVRIVARESTIVTVEKL